MVQDMNINYTEDFTSKGAYYEYLCQKPKILQRTELNFKLWCEQLKGPNIKYSKIIGPLDYRKK